MIFGEGTVKDAYRRVVWGPGLALAEAVPSPWEHRVLRTLGRVAMVVARSKRAEVVTNLRRAFPDGVVPDGRSIEQVAEDVFASHFANQYIGFSFEKCHGGSWPEYLAWIGLDQLEAIQRSGRGVVLAHPHMGPAQLPLHVLGTMGRGVFQIGGGEVTRVQLSETGRWAAQKRAGLEQAMPVGLHDGRRYLRPLLRTLENGGLVLTACDGTGGGTEVGRRHVRTVLGQPMPLPVGPVWLAAQSGAALLTLHCTRNPGDGALYLAEIGEEIPLDRDAPLESVLEAGVDGLAQWLDRTLRDHPGDWLFWDGFAPGGLLA